MSSEYVGIEDARGRLGDLVTAAQQGVDTILTRNRRPVARITRYQEVTVIDIAELTKRFGLPENEQSAVAAWTGEPWDTTWSEEDADQLHQAWEADQIRIDDERG